MSNTRAHVVMWLAFAVAALITIVGLLMLGTEVTNDEGVTCGTAWGVTVHGMEASGGELGREAEVRESERQCKGPARRLVIRGVQLVAVGAAIAGGTVILMLRRQGRRPSDR